MTRNVGITERLVRGLVALGMIACAFMAPMAAELRLPLFGALGGGLLFTALTGSCLGNKLVGRNSCASRAA